MTMQRSARWKIAIFMTFCVISHSTCIPQNYPNYLQTTYAQPYNPQPYNAQAYAASFPPAANSQDYVSYTNTVQDPCSGGFFQRFVIVVKFQWDFIASIRYQTKRMPLNWFLFRFTAI